MWHSHYFIIPFFNKGKEARCQNRFQKLIYTKFYLPIILVQENEALKASQYCILVLVDLGILAAERETRKATNILDMYKSSPKLEKAYILSLKTKY